MNIGLSLKTAQLKAGKTQIEISLALGVNETVLNRHFNSEFINLKLVKMYADYFGIKPSELIALGE